MAVGARQYDRGIRLTVIPPLGVSGGAVPPVLINPVPPPGGGVALPQIHVRFTVEKSLTPEPQRATISIYGLQKTTRDSIAGAVRRVVDWIPGGVPTPLVSIDGRILPADPIVVDTSSGMAHLMLEAGYGAALSQIFAGTATAVRSRRHAGIDWITTIHAGDSELGLSQGEANKSFAPGTPASVVLQYLASTCGLTIAPTTAFASLAAFTLSQGFSAIGRARKGIEDMLAALQHTWWVEDGVLWILGLGEFVPGPPIFVTPQDLPGFRRLLEAPERLDDGGVRVHCQLAPEISPGRQIQIVSSELAGVYRVEAVTQVGDNRTGSFESTAICRTQDPLGL